MIQAEIERCAGIDVGKKWLAVCIMVGPLDAEPRSETRKFGTNVADLEQLRDWLKENGITHTVMGHKTDNKDGHWLAHLLRHAMIQPSFIPKREIRELRDLTRRRKKLIGRAPAKRTGYRKCWKTAT